LSAVGQLVAGVAHELNNPLTTIKGYSQLLSRTELPLSSKQDLGRIDEAAERCRRIVQNLLTFARRHESEKAMCNINEILEKTLSLQEYRFRVNNIQLVKDLQTGLPDTLADRYQLQQVFLNIIGNAEHAMRATDGGTLTVSSSRVGGSIRVSIKDTGPGMSPEVQSRIFDPFFTTKGVGEGTGLGLSICYGIVQDHGGEIGVRTKPGGGATFVIELPLRRTTEPLLRRGPASELPPSRTGSRILVVDDEEAILELVERTLSQDGFVVDTAMTGIEALTLLDKEVEKAFDLILTDVKMPGLDGPRLYAHLCENRPGLEKRVVFMTGDTSSPETQAFLESAKATYIGKPFELDALKDLVRRSLAELSTQSE
jgi:two-component system NtrC family sensor kinase